MEETEIVKTIQEIVGYALGASGAAAWASSALSDGKAGGVWRAIMAVVNIIGGNVGKAKNDEAAQ